MYEVVADIFEKEPTPAVVATVNLTQDAHGQVVRPGTILFPSRTKKTLRTKLKSLRKKGEVANAEFTTTVGTKVYLPMDCTAGFSTQVKDVKLYLPEVVPHLTMPVEVKCFAQQKSRHCSKMSNITLTEVCKEVSITGGLTVEGSKVKDHQFDIPLDLPVQVACIELAKEELQQSLYARVKSTYESVDRRFATNKKVVVSGDAHDKAQQEFYCAVRTDTAQDVVTVDVPERIYDEVGFGNGKCKRTSSTYKGVQHSSSAGAHPAPKQPVPPLPPHCFERSKDEPYQQLMNRADAIRANASALSVPTPSAPLPHSNFGITTVPAAMAIDTYDEPITPQSSTNALHTHKGSTASPVHTQVPTPPLLPLFQKTTTANHHEPSVPLNSTTPPALRDAASKMRSPTTALGTTPPLPVAQEKKQTKRTPPPLHSKPLQPILSSPPQGLPRRQETIYEEIQPNALDANVYTPLVRDIPIPPRTRLKPAPKSVTYTKPQLKISQIQAGGSKPGPVDEVGNINYLKTLSCNDIIRLLEAMGLHQYIDSFMQVSETDCGTHYMCIGSYSMLVLVRLVVCNYLGIVHKLTCCILQWCLCLFDSIPPPPPPPFQ